MAGVIPPIFASAILLFPATVSQFFATGKSGILGTLTLMLSPGQPLYIALFMAAIIFFAFFYTALVYNPEETADTLKKSGAFIPGMRPGEQTARYIDTVMTRLTLVGALYLAFVCLLPQFLVLAWNVPFVFGGTSLLIVVVVVMDMMQQVQTHLMSYQYESLMKKVQPGKGGQ
jgi:preprotein translocase subunit SecY